MKFRALLNSAAILVAASTTQASAATLLFELSGGRNVTFLLDSNPTPSDSQSFFGELAVFNNVAGTVNGANATIDTISFGTGTFAPLSVNAAGLGFTQYSNGGPLFTGLGSAPVFSAGTFELRNFFFPEQNSTLVISEQAVAAVPEPATWMLMLMGIAGVGFAMRRKDKQTLRVRYT